jgi:hypothetical protein
MAFDEGTGEHAVPAGEPVDGSRATLPAPVAKRRYPAYSARGEEMVEERW